VTAPATTGLWEWYLELDWMQAAACRGRRDVNFFPSKEDSDAPARAVCSICPVAEPCLAYALEHKELVGIWGGTSARRRDAIRDGRAERGRQ
jgi:WhiB family redox-sensing transcriptional regulator